MVVYGIVLLFSLLGIAIANVSILTNPAKRCVPTATQLGDCHICICTVEGIYHCQNIKCDLDKIISNNKSDSKQKECTPYYTYRQDTLFCSCDATGHWRTERCRNRFRQIRSRTSPYLLRIGTNIPCTTGHFYISDCNICSCSDSGYISFDHCTNRQCPEKSKVDRCNPGDIIRTEKELCSCSSINYFIDRLCLKVTDEVIQEIAEEELEKLLILGDFWDNLLVKCKPYYTYTMDCSTCDCDGNGKLHCDAVLCANDQIDFRALRVGKAMTSFHSLPQLNSLNSKCNPGVKYRYKCNTCHCTNNRMPICTTMLCLDEIKLTAEDLKKKRRSF